MERKKQMEIMTNLRNKIKELPNLSLAYYGATYVIAENKNFPDYFVYAQIGDWVTPHTATLYRKLDCFTKKQASYGIELGCGENIDYLLEFINEPKHQPIMQSGRNPGLMPTSRLYITESSSSGNLKQDLLTVTKNWEQQFNDSRPSTILNEITHIEVIQKDLDYLEVPGCITKLIPTILRVHCTNDWFDYNCSTRTIDRVTTTNE